jgi:hypothetical protein
MRSFTAETRRRGEKSGDWIKNAWHILCATLNEIFDESAYDRFLLQKRIPRSAESYRAFMQEKEAGIAQRPKCC